VTTILTRVKVVIPAAGLGIRFLPMTRAVPKELLLMGDKPLIHHALIEAEKAGFDSALIVTSRHKTAIRIYFETDPELERLLSRRGESDALARLREAADLARRMNLSFVEQPEPLGMGDAVLRCRELTGSQPFGVLLPDDVVQSAGHWQLLRDLNAATGAPALCIRQVPADETSRFGIVDCEKDAGGRLRVRRLVEKPATGTASSTFAIFGRYIVTEKVLDSLAMQAGRDSELQLTDGFAAVVDQEPGVFAVVFNEEMYDAGTPAEYMRSLAQFHSDREATGRSLDSPSG
jgi:UTP--glucose-1-phosphate uridylyltransferase